MAERNWALDLLDYRRQSARLYAAARDPSTSPEERWKAFRRERDRLFREHPQSALSEDDRTSFPGLDYYEYSSEFRFVVEFERVSAEPELSVQLEQDGEVRLSRVGRAHFSVGTKPATLTLYWIHGYGGGLFLPFRDETNGRGTYGGGRYLLDSIKGADLGVESSGIVLDFNFAYNPSCAYNPRWHCPLAPIENWLDVAIVAGERSYKTREEPAPDPTAVPM